MGNGSGVLNSFYRDLDSHIIELLLLMREKWAERCSK